MKNKIYSDISFSITGPAHIEKEENWYVSTFLPLDVCSQGKTIKQAKERLAEAVALYIKTLYRMGTLEDVLIERGFKKITGLQKLPASYDIPFKKENIVKKWNLTVPVPFLKLESGRKAAIA